jgi:hypothetical protein
MKLEFLKDPSYKKTIVLWLCIGLIIRLVFMPIAVHADLITEYSTAYDTITTQKYAVNGFTLNNILNGWVYLGNIRLFHKFLPDKLWTNYSPPFQNGTFVAESQFDTWNTFIKQSNIKRTLFLMKIPHLIFDLLCLIPIFLIFENKNKLLTALKFWMISPAIIFSTYIFGKLEVMAIFTLLLSLYYLKKNKFLFSIILLTISIFSRMYGFFFLPFYLAYIFKKSNKKAFVLSSLSSISFIIIGILILIIVQKGVNFNWTFYKLKSLESILKRFLLATRVESSLGVTFYPFIIAYVLILLKFINSEKQDFNIFWKYLLAVLLTYFGVCYFHPQFLIWLSPFIILSISEDKQLMNLHLIQLLLAIPLTFHWGQDMFGRFFASLNPDYLMNMPSPADFISKFITFDIFNGIMWSIFSGFTLWMLFTVIKKINKEEFLVTK